ncbi:MAG TPA: hypothetical protein VGK44_09675 [Casimicrobiaceae bacterium]|jgi:hypothetical protein
MDIAESEKAEAPIAFQIARIVVVATIIIVAVWLVTSVVLDWLGAPLLTLALLVTVVALIRRTGREM